MRPLILSVFLGCGLLRADFNAAQWPTRAPLTVQNGSAVSEFIVPPEIFHSSAQHLSDIRIIRDGSAEVPYLVRVFSGDWQQNEHQVEMINKSFTKGVGVQAVLDLGEHAKHNRLRIATSLQNFKQTVIVETSEDQKKWATVLADGVIFDVSRPETNVANLTVSYPTSTRRYVRITIPGWDDPAYLQSALLAENQATDATRDEFATLQPKVTEDAKLQTTDVQFDLGANGQPCDRLVLQVGPGKFSRSIEIASSADAKDWTSRAGFTIMRTATREDLTVEWPETWDRYIRLKVFNADSAPLHFNAASASAIRRTVRFPSNAPGAYALYIGNPDAREPSYDFSKTDDAAVAASPVKVGAIEANATYRPPEPPPVPFSERFPWALNAILGVAVAVMAFVTYRFARKATAR